jgi:hypothetical protein
MSAKSMSAKSMSTRSFLARTSLKESASPAAEGEPSRRGGVPELQRQLLIAGISQPEGRLWFAKGSANTLATTYAALISLQRKKLIAPEKAADPHMMSWKITQAGKAAVAEKSGRRC